MREGPGGRSALSGFYYREAHAGKNRRHELLLDWPTVDLALNQRREQERALRMANQDDAASAVVVIQIGTPRITYVVVGDFALACRMRSRDEVGTVDRPEYAGVEAGERNLAVQRC